MASVGDKIGVNTVIWRGTAEVNHRRAGESANECMRVPVALLQTPARKKEIIAVEWEGKWIYHTSVEWSREYEDAASGELIRDVDPAMAARIDAALANSER